jgi:hypothetical protein
MPALHQLVVRDDNSNSNLTPTMLKLLIALVVLVVTSMFLIAGLLVFRWVKRSKKNPDYEDASFGTEKLNSSSNYRRLTVDTFKTTPAYAYQEKRGLMESSSPPASPLNGVPEIRITFPDEVDTTGRPQSGRVVVVRMGENNAVGLEPVSESLPPYEKESSDRFQSLDLDRIGGLKEKDLEKRYS